MKIACSTGATAPNGPLAEFRSLPLDPRFGRAAGFVLYDTDSGAAEYVNNEQNLNLAQGAGIQSAMTVANAGAKAVLTGHVGPKAFAALNKGAIAVHLCTASTVGQGLDQLAAGDLPPTGGADVEGHW
ncbi:MAG: dinitrogenase iron-molybdenum cofactor biosynthesis protein [Desulfovibrionaceae bacterium]|jgi:predicted Fe-Mo cluster-binding NifX family protein|nr:dinitrogenase iron-molybdenum cofactor biosynthesis protein [Desulfovibrionaceae bacterium]